MAWVLVSTENVNWLEELVPEIYLKEYRDFIHSHTNPERATGAIVQDTDTPLFQHSIFPINPLKGRIIHSLSDASLLRDSIQIHRGARTTHTLQTHAYSDDQLL